MTSKEMRKKLGETLRSFMTESEMPADEFLKICKSSITDLEYYIKYRLSANKQKPTPISYHSSLIEPARNNE